MIVKDPEVLARFRRNPRCEYCGRPTLQGAQPHHIFARGLGGGGRLDIPENLVALDYCCHRRHHDGFEPTVGQLLEIAARREGKTVEQVVELIHGLRRTPKH